MFFGPAPAAAREETFLSASSAALLSISIEPMKSAISPEQLTAVLLFT
jgi:hypothetical protein